MSLDALEWPKEGNSRVPYRVFADPDIYRAELERIFLGPSWQYLVLANELPEVGDYKTTFVGETPVIVARGEDGSCAPSQRSSARHRRSSTTTGSSTSRTSRTPTTRRCCTRFSRPFGSAG